MAELQAARLQTFSGFIGSFACVINDLQRYSYKERKQIAKISALVYCPYISQHVCEKSTTPVVEMRKMFACFCFKYWPCIQCLVKQNYCEINVLPYFLTRWLYVSFTLKRTEESSKLWSSCKHNAIVQNKIHFRVDLLRYRYIFRILTTEISKTLNESQRYLNYNNFKLSHYLYSVIYTPFYLKGLLRFLQLQELINKYLAMQSLFHFVKFYVYGYIYCFVE